MQKLKFLGILVAVILLALAIGSDQSARAQAEPQAALSAPNPASLPWKIGWVDESTSASVGAYPSVAYSPIDDLPYITYYDAVNGHLMLSNPGWHGGLNCGTDNNWWCRVVDGNGAPGNFHNVGTFSSLAFWKDRTGSIPGWKLGIAYHDVTGHGLMYAVYTETPTSWVWDVQTIVSTGQAGADEGLYTSLKFDNNGRPWIAYYSSFATEGRLKLAWFVGTGGNCGEGVDLNTWQCEIVDSGYLIGRFASLGIDHYDAMGIAYYDYINGRLKYAVRSNGPGNCGTSLHYNCIIVDGGSADVGMSASLTMRQNIPDPNHIAYYDKTNGKLKYAVQTDSGANCGEGKWWCGIVDSIGANISQVGISMTLDKKGYPIIAYEDASDAQGPSHLKIARPASALDLGWGNCGDRPPGYLFTYWQCSTLDTAGYGQGWVDVAAYTSVAISRSGLATIAYYETDSYDDSTALKFATQWFQGFLPLVRR